MRLWIIQSNSYNCDFWNGIELIRIVGNLKRNPRVYTTHASALEDFNLIPRGIDVNIVEFSDDYVKKEEKNNV